LPLCSKDVFHICEQHNLVIDDEARKKLELYEILLREYNKSVNLISRKDVDNIWTNHILHSLSPLLLLSFAPGLRLLDIGTGGGLPGIPIAIARPDLSISLVDSIGKKTVVLDEIVIRLGIQNVRVTNGRVESLAGKKEYRSRFEGIVARAVAPLHDLVKWSRPLLVRDHIQIAGGTEKRGISIPFIVALKGGDLSKEIAEALGAIGDGNVEELDIGFSRMGIVALEGKKIVIVEYN